MTSTYYNMTDSTGESGFLPTVTFTSLNNTFTAAQRTAQLAAIGVTGYYEADFDDNTVTIDANAFLGDTKVVVVTINKVQTIRASAFEGCTALRAITLDCAVGGNGRYLLTSIETSAFQSCTSLRNLHIPDTVKVIPVGMCQDCTGLEVAVMGYGWDRSGTDGNAYITDGSIEASAFSGCTSLAYFVVPETVGSIGDSAFTNNTALTHVYILGTPTVSSNAFSGARNLSTSIYYYNTTNNIAGTFPTLATKRPYTEYPLTATGELTPLIVRSTIPANTYWKGKIAASVTSLATSCFAGASNGADIKFPYMVALSLPPGLHTIGYSAFYNAVSGYSCITGAFYIPNTVTTLVTSSGTSNTFAFLNTSLSDISTTKQIVFQSGPSTIAFPKLTCNLSPAMAIIVPNVTSFGQECFNGANKVQLYSFFQKNAYTSATRLDDIAADQGHNAFTWNFNKGGGYTHYLYIPKQITRMAGQIFRGIRDKIYVTAYHNTISTTGFTAAGSGLGFGYFSYSLTDGADARFTGTAPTINLIYNYSDINGNALTTNSNIGTGFPYHVLYPANVSTITNRFAGLVGLKSIAVHHSAPQTVVVNDGAFYNCSGLNYVYFNNRVTVLKLNAFRNIPLHSGFDLIDAAPLREIYHAVFYTDLTYTSNIRQITIPNTVKVLGSYVFGASETLLKQSFKTLSFATDIEFWGDATNTRATSNSASDYGYNSTTSGNHMAIPANFCHFCGYLESVSFLDTVDENGADIPTEFSGAFVRPNPYLRITIRKNKQTLTKGLKRIGIGAFIVNHRLQSIRIPDGVTYIDVQAFYDNYSVSYLYLPDTLTTIGSDAFSWMNISNKFGAPGNDIYVRAPANLIDSINNTNFQNSTQSNIYYVTVSFNKSSNKVTNGVLGQFTTPNPTRIYYNVAIEDGIHSILGGGSRPNMITVTISDTVTNIQTSAFQDCTSLQNVIISPTSSLSSIGTAAFYGCTAITTFFIPNSVISLGVAALEGCVKLSSVTFGDNPGLKYIDTKAFFRCMNTLTNIRIPASVISIGSYAFINTSTDPDNNLTTVNFDAGSRLKTIHGLAFGQSPNFGATRLRECILPGQVKFIGASVFRNARSTMPIFIFPSSMDYIPDAMFWQDGYPYYNIKDIYFPITINPSPGPRRHNGYKDNGMDVYCFPSSTSATVAHMPSSMFSLFNTTDSRFNTSTPAAIPFTANYYKTVAYSGSTLTTLDLSASVLNTTISTTTTQVHAAIQEGVIVIGGGANSIAGSTADRRSNLISVNIPSTVTDISQNAFNGCGALVYVTFSENSHLTTIGTSAFNGCSMIHDIQLPNSLTTIGQDAFNGCTNLATISIPYNVTGLGSGAFQNTGFRLVPNAYKVCNDITADTGYFGQNMALSKDGKFVVASAADWGTANDTANQSRGYVRVYEINGSSWIQRGAQAIGDYNTSWQYVGYTVAINKNGTIYAYSKFPNGYAGNNIPQVVISIYQNGGWVQLGSTLYGTPEDYFGRMSFSDDGYTIAIGGWNIGSGYVKIYSYNSNSQWVQVGNTIWGERASDYSGQYVSLSADGTTVAIGAISNDGTNASTTDERGHARIYKYRTVTDPDWNNYTHPDTNTTFSYNNKPIVANGGDTNPVANTYYWVQMGQDIDGTNAADNFGRVSLSDDGQYVAIGAPNNDTNGNNAGQVQVYQYNGSAWVKLGGDILGEAANDLFGTSVSLSYYNSRIRVAIGAEAGAGGARGYTRVFEYDANKTAAITDKNSLDYGPSKWRRLYNDINGLVDNDRLGGMVSISADGNRLAVAARKSSDKYNGYGYVQVYDISAATPPSAPVRIHEHLYNDISGTLSTYFTSPSQISFQVVPELLLTNTLHPSSLTISQINNIYIRYRQSQLGFPKIAVNGSGSGGILTTTDISNAINAILASGGGFVHLDISASSIPAIAFLNNLNIYSVAISKTVVTIDRDAFNGCTNLSYLSFHPDSICTTIGQGAFNGNNIFDLALPDSLTTIVDWSFQSSTQLTSVCIPANVTSIGEGAFFYCTNLTSVTVPTGLSNTLTSAYYFNTNSDGNIAPANRVVYNPSLTAIPHFKLSDYSIPTGIIQNVVDSQVKYIDHRAYAYYPEITLYAINVPQTSGPYSYVANGVNFPIMPAAYLLNGYNVVSNSTFPLFISVPDLNVYTVDSTGTNKVDDTDDFYILMPGYSICIYNNLYDEENLFTDTPTYRYYDNEFGNVPLNIDIGNIDIGNYNKTSSILFMLKGCILSKKSAK